MNRMITRALLAGALLVAPGWTARAHAVDPDVIEIDILYTSDMHGHIDPARATFMNPEFPPPLGGGASAATYINAVRSAAERDGRGFMLLDSGDLFQGTPVGIHTDGKAVIEWMNDMGYTSATLGNHDFDHGWTKAKELVDTARFPILCANLYDTRTNQRVDWVKDMIFVDVHGVKVAVLGMITEATGRMAFAKNVEGLNFRPVHEMLPTKVEEARKAGAQIVLFPVHAGLPYKPNVQQYYRNMIEEQQKGEFPKELEAMEIAHYVPGIDVIFAGHSHQGYDQPWQDPVTHTVVVEPYANGSSVGHITLKFNRKIGEVVGYDTHADRGALITLFEDEFWPDEGTAETIGAKVAEAEKGLGEVIGETRVNLVRGDVEHGNLGALVADAMRSYVNADIAVQNSGGVRADIAPGEVTRRNCLEVLPFDNKIVLTTVKGEFLLRLLNQKVGRWGPSLFVSGATIDFDPFKPEGERVLSVRIGDQPLDPNRDYKLALTDYLAEGNSGMTIMREVPEDARLYTGNSDREALERYIRDQSPINPKSSTRWVKVTS